MVKVTLAQFKDGVLPKTFEGFIQQLVRIQYERGEGLSVAGLARKLGIPERTMHSYAKGETFPRKGRVQAMEEVLGIKLTPYYDRPKAAEPVPVLYVSHESHSAALERRADELEANGSVAPIKDKLPLIIERRKALGWSAAEFAAKAGLNKSAWKRVEEGTPCKNRRQLIRAAWTRLDKLEQRHERKALCG